ncbi:hypothetical protein L0F63_001886 [Massospora cicadina]|nr:hypothetical protein L0F63_001886 [Massospora cicadina]
MSSFLSTSTQFKLPAFSTPNDNANSYRFAPLPSSPQSKATRSIWSSTPAYTPQLDFRSSPSPSVDSEERVSKALHDFIALFHQRIYHDTREITRAQAQLSSGIKRLEATAIATNTTATQYQKGLRENKERLISSIAHLHQEMAKTRLYLQGTFNSLRRTRESLNLMLDEGLNDLEILAVDAQSYPNLYQLTYRHFVRPHSYHHRSHSQQADFEGAKPRFSLDFSQTGRPWSISRASALRHLSSVSLPTRDRGSVSSLLEPVDGHPNGQESSANSSTSSLIATAISKVHFTNSKVCRQLSSDEGPIPLTNTEESTKRKSLSIRSTFSLAGLRTFRKIIPPQASSKSKPLNAKDRLHQIAGSSQSSAPSQSNLFRWFPIMFREAEPSILASKPKSVPHLPKVSQPPTLPALERIDYRIDLNPTGDRFDLDAEPFQSEHDPLNITPHASALPPVPYLNSIRPPSFPPLGGSALAGPSPLQNEIG